MGNQVVHNNNRLTKKKTVDSSRKSSRNSSAVVLEDNFVTHFVPVDKLTKILNDLTSEIENIHGVSIDIFTRYLFPNYQEFGNRFYCFLLKSSGTSLKCLNSSIFKQQIEKFLSQMNDRTILDIYVQIYSNTTDGSSDVTVNALKDLFLMSYRLATDDCLPTCNYIDETIDAAVSSCFHGKQNLSATFVGNWLWHNTPKLLYSIHRYVVHVLTTSYRNGKVFPTAEESHLSIGSVTPVIENTDFSLETSGLLPISHVWLLSTTLPSRYVQIEVTSPTEENTNILLSCKMTGIPCPSHWSLLYSSDLHGAAVNRLLHHVLGYRGPTILFIRGSSSNDKCVTYCIGSTAEWHESNSYWGDNDSIIIQLQPMYRLIEKGPKLLYLNTLIRGYAQGLRAGSNTRNPVISVDQSFNSVTIEGAPYRIMTTEVWGCGDRKLREKQLDIKKWQVKEAEKQRVVKLSSADWMEHPDRYLLELAGRPTYSNAENN